MLSWLFTQGLDPNCNGPCTAANCCGVHIHEGTSCADADSIGGHFWNMDLIPEDPWQDIRYTIQGGLPSGVNDLSVTTGLGPKDINGRTVVVHDFNGVRIGCATIKICIDSKTTVKGAIDKLEMAVDHIKDALEGLGSLVNGSDDSGKGLYYHSSHGHYGKSKDTPYKCNDVCADICSTQHPQPEHCQAKCKTRQNAILDIVGVFCKRGLCPSLLETNEEVGLLQARLQRSEEEELMELDATTGGLCREPFKYCQLFCGRGFLLPPGDAYDATQRCREECNANFSPFIVALQKYVDNGCCPA